MNLKELREKNKLSQAALAKALGVKSSMISAIESGKLPVSDHVASKVKEVFDVALETAQKAEVKAKAAAKKQTAAVKETSKKVMKQVEKAKKSAAKPAEEAPETKAAASVPEAPAKEEVVIDSAEYQKIVDHYTDKDGKLSYELLNKDLIKFYHSSSKARKMLEEGKSIEEVRLYVVGTKFRNITGNRDLTDEQVLMMAELLDEENPKGVFKEFNAELRRAQSALKQ